MNRHHLLKFTCATWLLLWSAETVTCAAASDTLQLRDAALRLEWTHVANGWQLQQAAIRAGDERAVGVPSGEYTLLYSATAPDKTPVKIPWSPRAEGFPEPSYRGVSNFWRDATSPVALNLAGEAVHFFPREATTTSDGGIVFSHSTDTAVVRAEWHLDPQFPGDVRVTMTVTARKAGYFSIATPSLGVVSTNQLRWAMVPGVFAGPAFEPDFIRAYAYGQGLPEKPVLARERTAATLLALVTQDNGATLAVVAEPGTATDPWAENRNTRSQWRLGLSHLNRRGELSPTLYHPVLGEVDSRLEIGETRTFRFRYTLRMADWYSVLQHAAYDIYRLKDFAALKHPEKSLSDRLLALHRYLQDPELSRWQTAEFGGLTLGAQQYGTTNKSGVVGSDGDAIKNSDYGAMWMLANMTGDPVLTRDRVPQARAFKFLQQQAEPGFFQGAAVGQYYLTKSRRFTEEWGDYVEPVGLTYYTLSDLGNMLLFRPDDADLRARFRLGAERLLSWQRADGSWEVAYDRKSEQPMFADLADYRPTFYGLLIAYRILGEEKYLAAARRGADWLIENAVKPSRYLGVCGDIRFAPDFATAQIAQALLDLHETTGDKRYREAGLAAARFYTTSVYTHPIPSTLTKMVNNKPRADWEISQVGLGFEHGGIIGSANGAGPILLASHAGLFVRVHQLTGDPLFLDLARAGALARDAFLDPPTRVASYYWSRMDAGAGPFPHHAWWQIGWITDYLISEVALRSGDRIKFPRGFITPKVGPHAAYGFAPGKVFGQPANLAWGAVSCDRPEVDSLLARSVDGKTTYAFLLNDSPAEITITTPVTAKRATLFAANGKRLSLETIAGAWRVTIPAFGLAVLATENATTIKH